MIPSKATGRIMLSPLLRVARYFRGTPLGKGSSVAQINSRAVGTSVDLISRRSTICLRSSGRSRMPSRMAATWPAFESHPISKLRVFVSLSRDSSVEKEPCRVTAPSRASGLDAEPSTESANNGRVRRSALFPALL